MRIDSSIPVPENGQTNKLAAHGPSVAQNPSPSAGSTQDQAQLSIDNNTVQRLKASLSQVPEIRQNRVDALRPAVSSGSYQVSNQQLSEAIGSDLLTGPLRLT